MSEERVAAIQAILTEAFSPTKLLVKDQSHLHAGHAGAKGGGGHFHVVIVADEFADCTPIERHRKVFKALRSMMDVDIHALRIDARTSDQD